MTDLRIIQIVPADGWCAVHEVDGVLTRLRLVCWALVKDEEGNTSVVDMDTADSVDFSHLGKTFKYYSHETQPDLDPAISPKAK